MKDVVDLRVCNSGTIILGYVIINIIGNMKLYITLNLVNKLVFKVSIYVHM